MDELGDVEAALAGLRGVREAVVASHQRAAVAYVVPRVEGTDPGAAGAVVTNPVSSPVTTWERVFDRAYELQTTTIDTSTNLAGWVSSYTGRPLPAEEMRVWIETTVQRILATAPRRVLEIGCGTGLLLSRIAPHCERYVGTDISQPGLDYVRDRVLAGLPQCVSVGLAKCAAHEIGSLGGEEFDLVVLNSVVQYFPDVSYLCSVLGASLGRLAPEGALFLGDLRNLALLDTFHADVEVARAPSGTTVEQIRGRIERRALQERELAVAPEMFQALRGRFPRITRIDVQLKRGAVANKMTRYRYDVVLHTCGGPGRTARATELLRWSDDGDALATRRDRLVRARPDSAEVLGVPNARLAEPLRRAALLRDSASVDSAAALIARAKAAGAVRSAEPEEWWRVADDCAYDADVGWSVNSFDGSYDVRLRCRGSGLLASYGTEPRRSLPLSYFAPNSAQQLFSRRMTGELLAGLRGRIAPDRMPAAVVAVEELPRDEPGDIDRAALPRPSWLASLLQAAGSARPADPGR